MNDQPGDKYWRKSLEVTAVQVWEATDIPDHPNGHMTARPGDWIITGPDGGRWVCEGDIFPLLYERVT